MGDVMKAGGCFGFIIHKFAFPFDVVICWYE